MSSIIFLLILAAIRPNTEDKRFPEAVEVFRCQFDANSDKDFDLWPDGWTRQKGFDFPAYTKIQIQAGSSPKDKSCLCIDLDGGGAAAFSPPIPIDTACGYVLEADLKTEGLKYDRAFISLTFLDAEKHTLSSSRSDGIADSDGWRKIRLGTIETSDPNARFTVVGLHVEPQGDADLHGSVRFSDIWLGRVPRLEAKTNHPQNFFVLPAQPKITCTVSGIDERYSEAAFELIEVTGQSLAQENRPLVPQSPTADRNRQAKKSAPAATAVYTAEWTPPIPEPGLYRIGLALKGSVPTADRREITIVVLESRLPPKGGIFGWSLPHGSRPVPMSGLGDLLEQAGISWVKYPLWCSEQDGGRELEKNLRFCEKLNQAGIELAAMLLEPPEPARDKFGEAETLTAADVFTADPKKWYTALEPIVIQMSHKVHYWQLGRDTDLSLLLVPNLSEKMKTVRAELDRVMEGMRLGIGWDWGQSLPAGARAAELPWDFVSISSTPPLTGGELGTSLETAAKSPLKSWVVLTPSARGESSPQARAEDLIDRMVAAKIHGAAAVFCPDPFDPKTGLMNSDGTPNELFMPWRTTALEIGGAQFIGEMSLPHGSRNWVFTRDQDAVMYVWNRQPREEILYLGDHVKQTDLWGRTKESLELDGHQLIKADPAPSFVTGINKPIAEWSVGLQLEKKSLPSSFGLTLENSFHVKNSFPGAVKGKAVIVPPPGWIIEPRQASLRLSPGEELKQSFRISLPATANSGRNRLRIDFEVQTDRTYHFSVYRFVEVGGSDVRIEVQTRLNAQKELEVEQHFINESEKPVSFRCELSAPDRSRLTKDILRQGPGENVQIYRIKDGQGLLGRTLLLRAEELDGPRILNYRFEAGE